MSLETGTFVILPAGVSFKANLAPEERQRGIWAQVYTAALDMNGSFTLPERGGSPAHRPGAGGGGFRPRLHGHGADLSERPAYGGPLRLGRHAADQPEPGTQPFREEQLAPRASAFL